MEANEAQVLMATLLRPAERRIRRTVLSMCSSEGSTERSNCAPALVSSTARVCRKNRLTPTSSSMACIWRLTALWVSASSSEAARKLSRRATASNARK